MLRPGQMLVVGAVREEGGSSKPPLRYYNSVVAINDVGEIVDAVDKVHLVPFGGIHALSPTSLARFGIDQLVAGPMNFAPGTKRRRHSRPAGGIKAVALYLLRNDLSWTGRC